MAGVARQVGARAACRCLAPERVAAWLCDAAASPSTEPRPGPSEAGPPPSGPPPAWTAGLGLGQRLGPAAAPLAAWLCCALAARLGGGAAEAALAAAELAAAPAGDCGCCYTAIAQFLLHGHFACSCPVM